MKIDTELIKKAKSGDRDAFTALYSLIYKDLYKFACFMTGSADEGEEAVADAVVDIYTGISKLRDEDKFKSWAFAIVANKCRKRIRKMNNKVMSLEDELIDIFEGKDTDLGENLDVRTAFMELSGEEKLIISYHVFGGYTSDEIGGLLHMNSNTVRTKIRRALTKMRKKVEINV